MPKSAGKSNSILRASTGQNQLLRVVPFLVLLLVLIAWEILGRSGALPAFMLPAPSRILSRLWVAIEDGTLVRHTIVTLSEVFAGLSLGLSSATLLGYGLAKSRTLERILAPYIVASQSVPVVAIAPLLVIWFGPGRISKVLICALIVFFPVLVNTIVGVRSVPKGLYELLRTLRATRWQVFRTLEIPAAMPMLLGGLKIGATLSVIGAVVGEFVGADAGLGFVINVGRGLYDTPLVFVAVLTLICMAMSMYLLVSLVEQRLLIWKSDNSHS